MERRERAVRIQHIGRKKDRGERRENGDKSETGGQCRAGREALGQKRGARRGLHLGRSLVSKRKDRLEAKIAARWVLCTQPPRRSKGRKMWLVSGTLGHRKDGAGFDISQLSVTHSLAWLQDTVVGLQAELQEAQNQMEAEESRHQEEVKTLKQEIDVLLTQRDTLQNQVTAPGTVQWGFHPGGGSPLPVAHPQYDPHLATQP